MNKILIGAFLIFFGIFSVSAQNNNISPDTLETVRIVKKKPIIYLEFVKIGCTYTRTSSDKENPCESKNNKVKADTFEGIFLRLHNNSRWGIELIHGNSYTYQKTDWYKLQDGRGRMGVIDGAELEIEYSIEAQRGYERIETKKGTEHRLIDVQAPYVSPFGVAYQVFLLPGRSVIFAVKREYLAEYLSVYVQYFYEWESSEEQFAFEEPKHRVYFSNYKLKKALSK